MTQVIARLKKYDLKQFNSAFPTLLIEAKDPDEACYKTSCMFAETMLKHGESIEVAQMIRDIYHEVKVTKVFCKDEKKLR
jgi:hypothetical protein